MSEVKINFDHMKSIRKRIASFIEDANKIATDLRWSFYYSEKDKITPIILARNSVFDNYLTKEDVDHLLLAATWNLEEENPDEVIENFIKLLSGIPYDYEFQFPFYDILPEGVDTLEISAQVILKRINFDEPKNPEDFSVIRKKELNSGVYLIVRQEGCIPAIYSHDLWRTGASEEACLFYRRFISLLFFKSMLFESSKTILPSESVIISGGDQEDPYFAEIPSAWLSFITSLSIKDDLNIEEMKEIASFLKNKNNDSAYIKRAIDWLFDAKIKDDYLNTFISLYICIEVILSHGLEMGRNSNDRLQDRCAYLLSDDVESREFWAGRFKKISNTRNNIFHGKINKITFSELLDAELLATRVISKELKFFWKK